MDPGVFWLDCWGVTRDYAIARRPRSTQEAVERATYSAMNISRLKVNSHVARLSVFHEMQAFNIFFLSEGGGKSPEDGLMVVSR